MTGRERVLAALSLREPDLVPYLELAVDPAFAARLCGEGATELDAFLRLGADGIPFRLYPPIYAEREKNEEGREFIRGGLLRTRADCERLYRRPVVEREQVEAARRFVEEHRERGLALFVETNIGWDPVILSMGLDGFSYALYDDPALVRSLLCDYASFAAEVCRAAAEAGFDFVWFTDDIAYKGGPMVSPALFRELMLPPVREALAEVALPWAFHSDGDISPLVEDLLELGAAALHPFEPGVMDIEEAKRRWGDGVCIIGNIDLRETLTTASPEAAWEETRRRIEALAPGGGYILSSANCITSYCGVENVLAMLRAREEFGRYRGVA